MEIYFAGGCFWGVQKLFSEIDGVVSTVCGYVNGREDIVPSYERVCMGDSEYRECVRVEYDSSKICLEKLLRVFFFVIDPSQEDGQGHDFGDQYRTGIYFVNDCDRVVIEEFVGSIRSLYSSFYTVVQPLKNFYRAEEFHQDYLVKHPNGYCHIPLDLYEGVKRLVED